MIILLILVFDVISISADPKDSAQYECGPHGRFEYCIDDIPGCVIGCHCHPGYYFDTDTKICEPNTKLLQSYRRQYALEPTRTPLSQMDYPEVNEQTTSLPTTDALDDHIDKISKNTDDLGDWLYNQFFKAIETQVINKTNENVISRRSGKGSNVKIFTNGRRKSGKKKQRQSSKKKDTLRRKLLRITEDDSLFNSDTDTDTDSSDSTSESTEEKDSKHRDHDHKKFVIVNKKPKPPLPSFVFLPNIDPQFYPPVGLPPPILPMYPMVPVPPVVPGFPSINMSDYNQNQTITGAVTSTSKITTASEMSVATESPTNHLESESSSTTTEPSTEDKNRLRKRYRKRKNLNGSGNETLRRLRQLVQNSALKKLQKERKFPEEPINRESIEIDDSLQAGPLSIEDYLQEANTKTSSIDKDKANFKYLSQLIHRMDLDDTKKAEGPRIKISTKSRRPSLNYQAKNLPTDLKVSEQSRRLNVQKYPQRPETSDSFYSKLGKQIATLIRDVDSKNERQIDIEIEHMDQNTPDYPIFSDLGSSPHSYWERFARSPSNYIKHYRRNYNYIKKTNDKERLFDIESKVESAVSTKSPMSLREIENFISKIKKSEDKYLDTDARKYQFYNNTLNINLWPQNSLMDKEAVIPIKWFAKEVRQHSNNSKTHISENNFTFNSKAIRELSRWLTTEHIVVTKNTIPNKKLDEASKSEINKAFLSNTQTINANYKENMNTGHSNMPADLKPTPLRRANSVDLQPQPRSNFNNYNNKRDHANYHYPFFNNLLEFKYPSVEKSVNVPYSRNGSPSYFQHEFRHFNYFT